MILLTLLPPGCFYGVNQNNHSTLSDGNLALNPPYSSKRAEMVACA